MNHRQRFLATMRYQPHDRCPILDFGFWDETLPAWKQQGLPDWVTHENAHIYFGMDYSFEHQAYSLQIDLYPTFEFKVLEDRGDTEVVQQDDGARVLRSKVMETIPRHVGHLLVDRASWEKYYKPRLNPDDPARIPADWDQRLPWLRDPNREELVNVRGGSLYGWLRNWMGLEKLSTTVYDDPALFEEMVNTAADCSYALVEKALQSGAKYDACSMWEDMAYNAGPLLSPKHFKKYLLPHYRRLADLLHSYGVDIIWLDCDGNIDALLPLWLEAGINCMFPIEIGIWADPLKYRRQYGKGLLMLGGFDKHILAGSKESILGEVERLAPLVEEGGFIPFCDHRVPPDVPFEHYLYYLACARKIWGKDTDLVPAHWALGSD